MDRAEERIRDELLVLGAQAGDARCLDLLLRRWFPRLLALARRQTGQTHAAEEACQEALLAIARGIRRLKDPALFGPWSTSIVRRKSADWIRSHTRERRHHKRQASLAHAAQPASPPDQDDMTQLRASIRRLPADQRSILFLFYMEGLGIRQIAELNGIPVGTVKSRMFSARAELARLMDMTKT